MNQHARKVMGPRSAAEGGLVDQDLGGIVLERYTCPLCGKSASRVQEPE
jgi:hypothetical protein